MYTFKSIHQGRTTTTTFTVAELVQHLQTFDQTLPVMITWEGLMVPVFPGSVTQETEKIVYGGQEETAVVINADNY